MAEQTLRPFHESIIDVIGSAKPRDLRCLAGLIKGTKIPKNHDEIAAAWNARTKEFKVGKLGVPDDLQQQKEMVEAEAREKVATKAAEAAPAALETGAKAEIVPEGGEERSTGQPQA